jgi:murein DD-endopeptidase MepM/ murein hydrolase activator NlpD
VSRSTGLLALGLAPVLLVGGCVSSVVLLAGSQSSAAAGCGPSRPAVVVDQATLPAGAVAGYSGDQLANAAIIMAAAQGLGLDARAQTLGVMTAMGESGLRVLDYGDAVGPDSRGLFQQRDNGAWGSYAERMDPATSARNFYRALSGVQGWESLPPTIAAHRVQRNADPFYYEPFWDRAVTVAQSLARGGGTTGATVAGVATGTGGLSCTSTSPGAISTDGWTKPAVGPVTSHYGMRVNPVSGVYKLHSGADVGAPCDAPIYAAAAGVVVKAGPAGGYGNLVTVDHGGGLTSRYAHMYNNGVLTQVGAAVAAGKQIGRVGSNGNSTGCHLHFEVRLTEQFLDPAAFMSERGAPLG